MANSILVLDSPLEAPALFAKYEGQVYWMEMGETGTIWDANEIAVAVPIFPVAIFIHQSKESSFGGEKRGLVDMLTTLLGRPPLNRQLFLYSRQGNPPASLVAGLEDARRISPAITNLTAADFSEITTYASASTNVDDALPACCREPLMLYVSAISILAEAATEELRRRSSPEVTKRWMAADAWVRGCGAVDMNALLSAAQDEFRSARTRPTVEDQECIKQFLLGPNVAALDSFSLALRRTLGNEPVTG